MKNLICILLLSTILFSCSNKNTKEFSLKNLSHPTLNDWFAYFQSADSSFSVEKFKLDLPDSDELRPERIWEDWEPDTSCLYVYSPNRDFYLDLDYYNEIEDGIYLGSDIDTKVFLIDVREKMAVNIVSTGSSAGVNDAFWVNDSVFVLLETSEYWLCLLFASVFSGSCTNILSFSNPESLFDTYLYYRNL